MLPAVSGIRGAHGTCPPQIREDGHIFSWLPLRSVPLGSSSLTECVFVVLLLCFLKSCCGSPICDCVLIDLGTFSSCTTGGPLSPGAPPAGAGPFASRSPVPCGFPSFLPVVLDLGCSPCLVFWLASHRVLHHRHCGFQSQNARCVPLWQSAIVTCPSVSSTVLNT